MHVPKLGSQVVWAQKLGCALVLDSLVPAMYTLD